MAIHSSTLAWKIPWMEEPGRLQSMGLQRVGHDRANVLSLQHVHSQQDVGVWEGKLTFEGVKLALVSQKRRHLSLSSSGHSKQLNNALFSLMVKADIQCKLDRA